MQSHSLINKKLATIQRNNDGFTVNTRFGCRSFRLRNIKPNLQTYASFALKAACLIGLPGAFANSDNVTTHEYHKSIFEKKIIGNAGMIFIAGIFYFILFHQVDQIQALVAVPAPAPIAPAPPFFHPVRETPQTAPTTARAPKVSPKSS